MEEAWKDVVGYGEHFMVSSYGRIFSKRTNKILKATIGKTGYYTISTKIGGRKGVSICFKVHRLVADAFLDPPCEDLVNECSKTFYKVVPVNHKDGNKLNNSVENLEWCSYSSNTKHAVDAGLIKIKRFGENPASLFTNDERYEIFLDVKRRGCSCRQKASEMGCTHEVISNIVKQFETIT